MNKQMDQMFCGNLNGEVAMSHFPIRILLVDTNEQRVVDSSEDIPQGVTFRVLETNVS